MLFGYPIEATAENWLHECLVDMLQSIHSNPKQDIAWPEIIPKTYRKLLSNRTGLRDRLVTYQSQLVDLNPEDLQKVSIAILEQNEIAGLLSGEHTCAIKDELPQIIHEPIKALFEFTFKLLTELGVRDRQYKVIFESTTYHVCPFCGCEYFEAPGAPRMALDHYLAESKYPFAAANLKNLVPMGDRCNSKYKLAENILYKSDGTTRRKSFYPYNHSEIRISLNRTKPFSGDQGIFSQSEWEIDFVPNSEETETWDEVFHIKERYSRDVLAEEYKSWLGAFAAWCRSATVKAKSIQDVIDGLQRYSRYMETIGISDRAFLKAAFFQMLHSECEKGNERVVFILSGLVFGVGFLS